MPLATTGHGPAIRPLGVDGEAGAGIARLFAATCPELGPAMAADPLERWRADERFRPDTLQLAHDGGRVVGAALVLVLAHTDLEEPTEALLGDLLVDPEAPVPDRLRRQLLAQALEAGAKAGATVARAIVQERDALTRELLADQLGFEVVDTIHFYETTLTA
ncbi:MAG: hypothetical protein ACRDT4_01530 [Micromonosporaceae bacterium]